MNISNNPKIIVVNRNIILIIPTLHQIFLDRLRLRFGFDDKNSKYFMHFESSVCSFRNLLLAQLGLKLNWILFGKVSMLQFELVFLQVSLTLSSR